MLDVVVNAGCFISNFIFEFVMRAVLFLIKNYDLCVFQISQKVKDIFKECSSCKSVISSFFLVYIVYRYSHQVKRARL